MLTKDDADKLADLIVAQSGSYSEIWITAALELYQKGFYEGAADAFTKARGSFDEGTPDYELLDRWVKDSTDKVGTMADTDTALVEAAPEEEEVGEVTEYPIPYDDVLKSMMITKADASEAASELSGLLETYHGEYAGNYIAVALDFYEKGLFEDAAENFEKARNSFMPEDNPDEWNLLDKWANDAYARSLAVTDVETGSDELEEPMDEEDVSLVQDMVDADAEEIGDEYEKSQAEAVEKADAAAGADVECMKQLWAQYYKYYSGKWIAAAQKLKDQGNMEAAAKAYQKAANGFEPKKNPKEYNCLRGWAEFCIKKAGKDVSTLDNLP